MEPTTIITGAAVAFLINIVTSLVKKYIKPKFGDLGVQIFAFVLALIGSGYVFYGDYFPGLQQFVLTAGAIFSTAVVFYEVLLKRISTFKGA